MNIIALIIIVILVSLLAKPKNATYFRMAAGSIFGIAFFGVWPFVAFLARLLSWSQIELALALTIFGTAVALLSCLPVITRINQIAAAMFVVLFLTCVFLAFAFEKNIKFYLARQAGFFSGQNPVPALVKGGEDRIHFSSAAGRYTVDLPATWSQKTLQPLGLPYFVLSQNDNQLAEFRPKCFHDAKLALPEIVLNIASQKTYASSESITTQCFRWHEQYNACLIRQKYPNGANPAARWRWLAVDATQSQGIELDFLLFTDTARVEQDVQAVIGSLNAIPLTDPHPRCFAVTQWF